jgi:Amt family ammonium transporter
VLAGLVAITAGCHAVTSIESLFIGIVSGILMFEARIFLEKIKLDDAVGAIPVHLVGGIWGTIAVGIFGDLNILGTNHSRLEQIGIQFLGVFSCAILSLSISFIFLGIINRFYPLRVSNEKEKQGLNYAEHRATTELTDLFWEMEYQKQTGDLSKNISVEPFTEVGQIAERYNLVLDKIRSTMSEKEELNKTLELNLNLIQNDLNTAKRIQSSILAFEDKKLSGLEISVRYLPLNEVGGDFFDITELRPGLVRVLLADATGHGVQAALITMTIKTIYESLKRGLYSVHELLFYLNNEFLHSFKKLNQFFTCIVVDIDTKKNTIRYCSAGHIPQYLIQNKKLKKLLKGGRMIGVKENAEYVSTELSIEPSSDLLLFTDGLIEEWNENKDEFGEERLEEILLNSESLDLDSILKTQKLFLSGLPYQDDITLIGVKRV